MYELSFLTDTDLIANRYIIMCNIIILVHVGAVSTIVYSLLVLVFT